MILQKIIAYFVKRSMVERLDSASFLNNLKDDQVVRYHFVLPLVKNQKVLDIASGDGSGTYRLSSSARKIIGVDLDTESIQQSDRKYQKNNLRFVNSNGFDYLNKHQNSFDSIISFETIEHLADYQDFIGSLSKSLKKNGTLYLSTPNKNYSDLLTGGTVNPYHVHEFYPEELAALLKKYFAKIEHYIQRPVSHDHPIFGAFVALFLSKSNIVPAIAGLSGLDDLFVCRLPLN